VFSASPGDEHYRFNIHFFGPTSVNEPATGEDGYFAFALTSGNYTLVAAKVGFTTKTRTLELLSTKRLDIEMSPGAGVIKGNVIAKSWVGNNFVYSPLPEATIAAIAIAIGSPIAIK